MDKPKLVQALGELCKQAQGINWVVIGSSNLLLQDVIESNVHDIDVETDKGGIVEFSKLFSKAEFTHNSTIGEDHCSFNFASCQVEVLHHESESRSQLPHKKIKKILGVSIPIVPLKIARDHYHREGHREKANLVDGFLKKNK